MWTKIHHGAFTHMCGVTENIRDCHRVELRPDHTETLPLPVASTCVVLSARQSAALINVDRVDVRGSSHNRDDRDSFK